MDTTQHTHPVVFGRKVDGCPRCTELRLGMPPRTWRNQRSSSDAQRLADIRSHDCKKSHCGPVCTFGDY
jgi:hypothetical protein